MKVLSIAHSCVAERFDGKIFYNGISPDEVALVEYAASMGFECALSNDTEVRVKFPNVAVGGKVLTEESFEVIKRMNFTSDRKRMSILVRDPTDGTMKLFIKGADSVIQERLANIELNKETDEFLQKASLQGLRTLLLAVRVVDEVSVNLFLEECDEAARDLKNKDKKLEEVYSDFEREFTLLGATAVEDRLQDGVPKTIYDLQAAGIKIWMLTGDKLETAENIGESCQLLKTLDIMDRYKISKRQDVLKFCSEDMVELSAMAVKEGRL